MHPRADNNPKSSSLDPLCNFRRSKQPNTQSELMHFFTNPLLSQLNKRPVTSKSSSRLLFTQGSSRVVGRVASTAVSIHRPQTFKHSMHAGFNDCIRQKTREFDEFRNTHSVLANKRRSPASTGGKPKNRIVKGLTDSSKPTLILSKQIRDDPFTHYPQAPFRKVVECGLFDMINAGHIPRYVDVKPFFNPPPDEPSSLSKLQQSSVQIQSRSPDSKYNSNYIQIVATQSKDTFLTEKELFMTAKSSPVNALAEARRSVIRVNREATEEKVQTALIKIKPLPKYLAVVNHRVKNDENYWAFRAGCLGSGNWSQAKQLFAAVEKFSVKYKVRKLEFLPEISNPLKRINEKDIIGCLKDSSIIKKIVSSVHKNSEDFADFRYQKIRSVMLTLINRHRFKKMLNQVKYINTFKRLYKTHKQYQELKSKMVKTLNFKYQLFADNQRLFSQNKDKHRRKVQIHINSTDLRKKTRETYYKFRQRINIQITRIFSFVKGDGYQIIYISPYSSVSKQIQQFYQRLINIKSLYPSSPSSPISTPPPTTSPPLVHFVYLKPLAQLKSCNLDEHFFYSLQPSTINHIRNLIKHKQAYIVPGDCSQTTVKLCYLFDVPSHSGTFTKQSLEDLFDREEEMNNSAMVESIQGDTSIRKDFYRMREVKGLMNKIARMRFANRVYTGSVKASRDLFGRLKLPVPKGLENWNKTNFYSELAKLLLQNKDKTLWIFKMQGESRSRGLAQLQTDSIKLLNDHRKRGIITHQSILQISQLFKHILSQKLRPAHPSLHTQVQYLQHFLERGGVIEPYIADSTSPCVFGEIKPTGDFTVLTSYRKINTASLVNNLALYPANQLTENQLRQCAMVAKELYGEGVYGYIEIQMLQYTDIAKKIRKVQFLSVQCKLNPYSSAHFMIQWLFGSLTHNYFLKNDKQRQVLYCPFIDNNGYKSPNLRQFFKKCQDKEIIYNPETKQGTLVMPIGHDTSQVLSVMCVAAEERKVYRLMVECLNGLNQMGGKCTQFEKEAVAVERSDGYYLLDTIWKLREVNRQLNRMGS